MRRLYIRRFQTKNKNKQDKYISYIPCSFLFSRQSLDFHTHTQLGTKREKKEERITLRGR